MTLGPDRMKLLSLRADSVRDGCAGSVVCLYGRMIITLLTVGAVYLLLVVYEVVVSLTTTTAPAVPCFVDFIEFQVYACPSLCAEYSPVGGNSCCYFNIV